jgi:uncharacterized protein YbbC (DUF1343 family)
VAVIRTMYHLYPESFFWKQPPYEYEEEKLPIDILAGTDELRSQIVQGCSLEEIAKSWQKKLDPFREVRKPYLLY